MQKLENKVVFITGGSSGIGRACAVLAARHGARVAIADLKSDENSSATLRDIRRAGGEGFFTECDVASVESVEAAIQRTVAEFGRLDVALNNAGIGGEANQIADMSDQGWEKVINVNLHGVRHCMKHELKQMLKQDEGGVIINMASILGHVGFANSSAYVAAKHGVLGLTKTAAIEYATRRIRVNAICPGFIQTPMLTNAGLDSDELKETRHLIESAHAVKRLGTAEEIAQAFVWLASDEASFVFGTGLIVDGGYLAQ